MFLWAVALQGVVEEHLLSSEDVLQWGQCKPCPKITPDQELHSLHCPVSASKPTEQ